MNQCKGKIDLSNPLEVVHRDMFVSHNKAGFRYKCGKCGKDVYVRSVYGVTEGKVVTPVPSNEVMRCPMVMGGR